MIACLINPAAAAQPSPILNDAGPSDARRTGEISAGEIPAGEIRQAAISADPSTRYDLSNVILFRALAFDRAGGRDAR
ncbi:hypothetical protein ACLBWX_05255 [Methylobacterium sp. M6A4_1b]